MPQDLSRGAQVYARALADRANTRPGQHHEIVALFAAPRAGARPDHELGVTAGRLRAAGVDPRAAWRLTRLVRRLDPDVVVAHGAEAMKYAAFVRRNRTPVILHAIGVVSPKALRGLSRALHTALVRRADVVTAVSEAVAAQQRDLFGAASESVRVIPNGREPAVFASEAPADRVTPTLIFVGHLTRTKRPDIFIDVVAALRRRNLALAARMVGDGPMREALTGPAAAAGIDLLGARSDVPFLLESASVFLFPSLAEGEGMPGVIIEAGLAGLPVIATDVPGVRDVVVDGQTGRVVAVDDIDGLVDAAEQLIRDPVLAVRMGAAARQRCTELFSLDASTDLFLAAFFSLVPSQAGTPLSE